ncbi:MAG: hypothetical protein PVI81_08345 [Anaerolineales bacterium]
MKEWKPAVPREWLLFCAGLIWCGVGLMLMRWSWFWSSTSGWLTSLPFLGIGFLIGIATRYFFRRMAFRNVERIRSLPEKACLFAFQSWTSYPLVIFMMTLGVVLKSTSMPRTWLAGLYLAIGAGLFMAGLAYYSKFVSAHLEIG